MVSISSQILFFICGMVLGLLTYTLSFKYPQRKQSGAVKSGERRGQLKSLLREIMRSPKMSRKRAIVSPEVCAVAPSCWNHNCGWFSTAGLKKFSNIVRYWPPLMETATPCSFSKKYGPNSTLEWV